MQPPSNTLPLTAVPDRPAASQASDPAPLAAPTLVQVRRALQRPLPGFAAQQHMSPQPRPGSERILEPGLNCRHAGVLVLLYPGSTGELTLVLTQRAETVHHHRGQISLPGGLVEAGETFVAAALREAYEELGIPSAAVEVLGVLSPVYIPHSGFCLHPVVGALSQRPTFVLCAGEVAAVIEAPLRKLLDPATVCYETWDLHGQPTRVPFYALGAHKVWGATAMILAELLALVSED